MTKVYSWFASKELQGWPAGGHMPLSSSMLASMVGKGDGAGLEHGRKRDREL